jgi:hypothetical protein
MFVRALNGDADLASIASSPNEYCGGSRPRFFQSVRYAPSKIQALVFCTKNSFSATTTQDPKLRGDENGMLILGRGL